MIPDIIYIYIYIYIYICNTNTNISLFRHLNNNRKKSIKCDRI